MVPGDEDPPRNKARLGYTAKAILERRLKVMSCIVQRTYKTDEEISKALGCTRRTVVADKAWLKKRSPADFSREHRELYMMKANATYDDMVQRIFGVLGDLVKEDMLMKMHLEQLLAREGADNPELAAHDTVKTIRTNPEIAFLRRTIERLRQEKVKVFTQIVTFQRGQDDLFVKAGILKSQQEIEEEFAQFIQSEEMRKLFGAIYTALVEAEEDIQVLYPDAEVDLFDRVSATMQELYPQYAGVKRLKEGNVPTKV